MALVGPLARFDGCGGELGPVAICGATYGKLAAACHPLVPDAYVVKRWAERKKTKPNVLYQEACEQ